MSFRSDALMAFDGLSADEWGWFAPNGWSNRRSDFRGLIAAGRVESKVVLRNVVRVRELSHLQDMAARLIENQEHMPIQHKRSAQKLEVVP